MMMVMMMEKKMAMMVMIWVILTLISEIIYADVL